MITAVATTPGIQRTIVALPKFPARCKRSIVTSVAGGACNALIICTRNIIWESTMNSPRVAASVAGALLLVGGSMQRIAEGAEFTLMPSPQTVHIGHFAANLKPVLSINSGDTVTIEVCSL